jgi:hypothetical protein
MKTLAFLGAMGGGYAVAHALGASEGSAAGIGWASAFLALYLASRWRGYRAAFRVERHRAVAQALRLRDPETYQQILNTADGEAAAAAMRDPDAYVALFLAAANNADAAECQVGLGH